MSSAIINANKDLTDSFITSKYWKVGSESTSASAGSNLYVGVTSSYANRRSRLVFYPSKEIFINQTITKITLSIKTKELFSSAAKTADTIIKYSTINQDTDEAFTNAKECASIKANTENFWYNIEITNENALKDISAYCKEGTPFSLFFGGGSYGLQYYGYEVSEHPTLTIEYIPSASTGNIVGTPKIGSEFSVNIDKVSAEYTHTVEITNGIKTITQTTSTEAVSFIIPVEETLDWIDNEEKTSILTCNILTFLEDSQIGIYSFDFILSVADILSVTWEKAELTTSYITTSNKVITKLISGYSTPKITLTAITEDGSEIKEYKIIANNSCGITLDKIYEGNIIQEQSLEVKPYTITDSIFQVTAYAINERGIRSEGVELSLNCYAYSLPSSILNILRTSDSIGTEDIMGTYIYNRTNFNYTLLDGLNEIQSFSVVITDLSGGLLEATIDSSNTELLFYAENASPESEYNIAVTIQDEISQNTLYASIPSSSFIIHIRKGGKAIGIGCASSNIENTISLGWKLLVDGGIEFNDENPISAIPLPIQNGGTGVTSYEALRQKLGLTDLNYLPLSGGTINGNLNIDGNLSITNANSFTYNNNKVAVFGDNIIISDTEPQNVAEGTVWFKYQ